MSKSITEGSTLKSLITNKSLKKDWIFNYDRSQVKGLIIEGARVFFPKGQRTSKAKLDKATLGVMTLLAAEEKNLFFLQEPTTVAQADVAGW